ncbi:MAG: OmpA family protein [Candidatus Desantisbacteria bacterium]
MIKWGKLLFVAFFLCLAGIGYGYGENIVSLDNTFTPPGVIIGKVASQWKGFLEMPVWTLTKASLAKESFFIIPEKQNHFSFGVVCHAENSCGFDESYFVSIMIEKETTPHSDKWYLISEDTNNISCKAKSVDIRNFLSTPILQKEPETRYRLTVCSKLTVGQKTTKEITYLTIKCSSEYQLTKGIIVAEAHIGHPMGGQVEDTGISIKGVGFEEQGTSIVAKEEGEQYTLKDILTGERLITAKAQGFKPASQRVVVSSIKSSYLKMLLIPEKPFVYGLVKDSATGEGLSGTTLEVMKGQGILRQTKAGLTGNYKIDSLNKGIEYTIVSNSEGYEKRRQTVSFGPEQTVARVDFSLDKALPPVTVEKSVKELAPPVIAAKPAPIIVPEVPMEILAPPMPEKPAPLKALAEIKEEKGIVIKESKDTIKIEISQEAVNFTTGSHQVQATAYPVLTKVANILKEYPDCKVMIEGHSDNVPLGPVTQRKYKDNKGLSQARANNVKAFLVEREGVPIANLTAIGYGESKPIVSNATPAGKARNRRVEVVIKKPEIPAMPMVAAAPQVTAGSKQEAGGSAVSQVKAIPAPVLPKPVALVPVQPTIVIPPVPAITIAPAKVAVAPVQPTVVTPPVPVVTPATATVATAPQVKEIPAPVQVKPVVPIQPTVVTPPVPVVTPATAMVAAIPQIKEIPTPVQVKPVVPVQPTVVTLPVPVVIPAIPVVVPLPKVYTMLTNGSFDDGMNAWTLRKEGVGDSFVDIVNDSPSHPTTIGIKRQKSQNICGEAGVSQLLDIGVHRYTQAILKAGIKIDKASMSGDGSSGGDYPMCLELNYTGTDGNPYVFKHGFHISGKLNYSSKIGEQIKKGEWIAYASPNLMQLSPRPVKITEIRIAAKGWDFVSRIDSVELQLGMLPVEVAEVRKPVPEIVIPEKKPQVPVVPQATVYAKLMNEGFEQGMECWQSNTQGSGKILSEIIKDDNNHPHSLEISRQDSKSAIGGISVSQMLDISVVRYNFCVLHGEIKIPSSSLSGDNQQGGVYPACIEIEYRDIAGLSHLFRHGFLTKGKLQYPEIGEMVEKNKWISYITPNLMELSPRPAKITCVRIKGDGWDFVSQVDNLRLELLSKPIEKPVVVIPQPKLVVAPPTGVLVPTPKPETKEEVKPMVKKEPESWLMDEKEALSRFGEMESAGMERLAESLVVDPKGIEELSILLVSSSINPKQAAKILYKLYQVQGDKAVDKVLKIIGDINPDKVGKIRKLLTK